LFKAFEPTIAAEVIEKGLEDDGIDHTQSLVQNEGLKQLEEERSLIGRHKLSKYVTKEKICATDRDAVLKAHTRKLFEVYRISNRGRGMRSATEGQSNVL
jgi:hypothetical protein